MTTLGFFAYGIGFFLLQLITAESLFAMKCIRRDLNKKRFFLGLLLDLLIAVILVMPVIISRNYIHPIMLGLLMYTFLALSTFPGLYLYYDISISQIFMLIAEGYMLQHLAAQLVISIREILNARTEMGVVVIFEILIYFFVYYLIYLAVIKKMSLQERIPVGKQYFFIIAIMLVVIVLSEVRDYYAPENLPLTLISRCYSCICCLFILMVLTGTIKNESMNEEIQTLKLLRKLELQQDEKNKENVDLINIKCHDLKRQIGILERTKEQISSEELQKLKSAVDMYDSKVMTGNTIVDTILTEKSLICKEKNIRLTCVADGEKLNFISPENICAIFGNAIDNAIEATLKVKDENNRLITLKVFERMGMLIIEIENTYDGEADFVNDLPITKKKTEYGFHGYGIKSIILAAKQYSGEVQISADDRFRLMIMIPTTS